MSKQTKALKLALEALDDYLLGDENLPFKCAKALAAIREALAERQLSEPCRCGKQTMAWCMANTCSKAEQPAQPIKQGWDVDTLLNKPKQPAQQEPVDKSGSPCPEFWDWLLKAYNFDGDGVFTKYNMEVAFLAGKQSVHAIDTLQERVDEMQKHRHDTSPPASKPWVGLTEEQVFELIEANTEWKPAAGLWRLNEVEFARAIEANLREKNA